MMWQKWEQKGDVSPAGVLWVAVLQRQAGRVYRSSPGCPRHDQFLHQAGTGGHPGSRQVLRIVGNYSWEKRLEDGWPGDAFLNLD